MSRIVGILVTTFLIWRLGLANTNNHQLSSSLSLPGSDSTAVPIEFVRSSRSNGSTISTSSSRRSDPRGTSHSQSWQQHVSGEGKLIDNKLRDKLLSYIDTGSSFSGRRAKREDVFSEDKINNFYDNIIKDERPAEGIPRITEEVLPIRNLTEERIREENELLEHLNREPFSDSAIRLSTDEGGDAGVRNKHPGGGGGGSSGKKGRRRKGHKKKIKRIKPSAAAGSLASGSDPTITLSEVGDPWRNGGAKMTDEINSTLTSVTKLSLNESKSQTLGRKKHRQKLLPGKRQTSQPSSSAESSDSEIPGADNSAGSKGRGQKSPKKRQDGNWDRKAGRELLVLNGDDIPDKNMQTPIRTDPDPAERVAVNLLGWNSQTPVEQSDFQRDRQRRKLTPAEKKARKQRQKELLKLEKQRKQARRLMSEDLLMIPARPEQLQRPPPASESQTSSPSPNGAVASTTDTDVLREESVSLQRVIISGDLSCMKGDFIPAPAIPNADIKYLRNDLYGLENSFLEAEYHCRRGFELRFPNGIGNNSNLICRKSRWIGKRPFCLRIKTSPTVTLSPNDATAAGGDGAQPYGNNSCGKRHSCQQACYMKDNSTRVCSCYKGFRMVDERCVDINECAEYGEDLCEYGCSNTIGSFVCKCPKGLRATDNNKCMDVNECLLRNGHGPCQDTCINTWSGYRCSCAGLSGTRLAEDGHSCEDIDECTVNNGGCSHTCLNTLGRAFCVCPEGYMLDDDWKTCIDIDECSNQKSIRQEFRCHGSCVNTIGSYRCFDESELEDGADQGDFGIGSVGFRSHDDGQLAKQSEELEDENDDTLCPAGYYFNTTMGDCQDTNECSFENGGCQHHCVNSDGSFYCSCKYGFKLDIDRHSCLVLNDSLRLADVACPPLFPPRHGYLECSRPIDEISDGPNGGRLKIINRPGSQCILKCPTGYRLEGKFSKICGTTGEWIGDESGSCIRYPQPKLTCPPSKRVELHPNDTDHTTVKLHRPKTDVSWERDIVAEPFWAKKDTLQLPLGAINISYTAKHPVSKLTASCTFTVNVMVGSPPVVEFCPDTQIYTIEGRHQSVKATWEEPIFSDNVSVITITKSNSPGTDFGAGSHLITYEAHDEAEWSSKCVFKIVVNVSKRKDVQHFQLPILYNRFYF
ncbi:uncharacterized protein LOC129764668 [Toxorhynchites rutilus septentrionalis]|uniref:uncharacterized protein LOC129764668 n=1 Tax=Toxorhynchites rutilus septentrionalis TaxID=329112 RepID=UPI00247A4049|nr:uncharacterized protein LOC129764668 [Toxorhynchites rutilus septentrionalis]